MNRQKCRLPKKQLQRSDFSQTNYCKYSKVWLVQSQLQLVINEWPVCFVKMQQGDSELRKLWG